MQIFKKHAKSYASALSELPKKDPDYSKLSEILKEAQVENIFFGPTITKRIISGRAMQLLIGHKLESLGAFLTGITASEYLALAPDHSEIISVLARDHFRIGVVCLGDMGRGVSAWMDVLL